MVGVADYAAVILPPLWAEAPWQAAAAALARQFHLSLRPPTAADAGHLELTAQGLQLHLPPRCQPWQVDFAANVLAYRRKQPGFGEALAKAVGVDARRKPQVLDITAGWGRDGFLLAHWGCQVTLWERHPVVAALLADGWVRAQADPELQAASRRMRLHYGDGAVHLAKTQASWDVIYLDPMFPPRPKSALVKQELQHLQRLVGAQPVEPLWHLARQQARRVVVKRPLWAPALPATPNFSVGQGAVRFEVFLGAG